MLLVMYKAKLWIVSDETMTEDDFYRIRVRQPNNPLEIERNEVRQTVCIAEVDFNQEVEVK